MSTAVFRHSIGSYTSDIVEWNAGKAPETSLLNKCMTYESCMDGAVTCDIKFHCFTLQNMA